MEEQNTEIKYVEKRQFYLFSFIMVIFLIAILIFNIISVSKNETKIIIEEPVTDIMNENIDTTTIYEIKEYNGKIGVFENGNLSYIIDTYIFTLPEEDKKLISEGIKTTDKNEFYEILAEYY